MKHFSPFSRPLPKSSKSATETRVESPPVPVVIVQVPPSDPLLERFKKLNQASGSHPVCTDTSSIDASDLLARFKRLKEPTCPEPYLDPTEDLRNRLNELEKPADGDDKIIDTARLDNIRRS
jgi:hypothetical protein